MIPDNVLALINTATGLAIFTALLVWTRTVRDGPLLSVLLFGLILLAAEGALRVVSVLDFPMLAGSLYFPAFCILFNDVSRRLSERTSRHIKIALIIGVLLLSVGNLRWLIFAALDDHLNTFNYVKRVTELAFHIQMIVTVYFVAIIGLAFRHWFYNLGALVPVTVTVLTGTLIQTLWQAERYHNNIEQIFLATVVFRMIVVLTYFTVAWLYERRQHLPGP